MDIFMETNLVQTWTKSVKKQALMISDHMYTINTPLPSILFLYMWIFQGESWGLDPSSPARPCSLLKT